MSILQKLVQATEGVEGLNGVYEGLKKLTEADGAAETAAAASQLAAELAITTAVAATVRTSMSLLRLGLAVSGQIWKWEALSWAAGATTGLTAGAIIDWVNQQHLGSKLYDLLHPNEFDRAKKWTWPRDPILLDLDGDGLETVGLTSNIHFDFDADGVLTKTGWAGKDDALLVWDRNANGSIDTGAELFGEFTVLPNGSLAPNGFAALAALDANGDGILDASDPAFAELKLWRDTDQDGVTGAGELIPLQDAGIVLQTRLKPYLDQIELGIDEAGLRLDAAQLNQTFADKRTADPENALADLLDLDRYAGSMLAGTNWDGMADFDTLLETLPSTPGTAALLNEFKVRTLTVGNYYAYLTNNADVVMAGVGERRWSGEDCVNWDWRMAA